MYLILKQALYLNLGFYYLKTADCRFGLPGFFKRKNFKTINELSKRGLSFQNLNNREIFKTLKARECNTCAQTGYTDELSYYSGGALKTVSKKEEAECAAECDAELDCVAILYQVNTKTCYLREGYFMTNIMVEKKANLWPITLFRARRPFSSTGVIDPEKTPRRKIFGI